jgi:uncharacterized caspase-like protein
MMGVTQTENGAYWQLGFAKKDARLLRDGLTAALEKAGVYEVVSVLLASNPEDGEVAASPTKGNLHTMLDLVAGRTVQADRLEEIPEAIRAALRPARPEDVVLLAFSGHGFADGGEFYLVPYDTGPDATARIDAGLRQRCISGRELAGWLRGVDAGPMALVVDACYSSAAVEGGGFKPAPLGGGGLGQLAYDKRMRVLAATQADNVAYARRKGLLTEALEEGLKGGRAAPQGRLSLAALLSYAAERVPGLYEVA